MVSNRLFAAPFGMVGVFVFGWRDVVEVAVDPLRVVPVDPTQRGEFDLFDRLPRSLIRSVDQLGLVETVHRFSQRIVIGITDRPDRRDGPDLRKAFGVSDRRELAAGVEEKKKKSRGWLLDLIERLNWKTCYFAQYERIR